MSPISVLALIPYIIYISLLVNKDLDCSPLDDSLTNMQWLGRMSTDTEKSEREKENYSLSQQESQEVSWCDVGTWTWESSLWVAELV